MVSASGFEQDRLIGLAVSPDVAQVELVARSGRASRIPTDAGTAYRGRAAGRVRFALLFVASLVAEEDPIRLVRMLAADGGVIGATESFTQSDVGSDTTVIARGGSGADRWVATVDEHDQLAPVPGEPERRERSLCLTVGRTRGAGSGGVCSGGRPGHEPAYGTVDNGCESGLPRRLYAGGFADADVTRVAVVLGNGSRVLVGTRPLPAALRFAPIRFFATALKPALGVRRIVAVDAGGREIGPGLFGSSPPATAYDCDRQDGFLTLSYLYERPGATGERLSVADRGDDLCVALGVLDPRGTDCELPPMDANAMRIYVTPDDRATTVGVVTAAEVAFVEAETDRGTVTRVATTPVPGYAGRYAAVVRSAVIAFPGRQRIMRVTPLAPSGGRYEPDDDSLLADEPVATPVTPVRTLFRARVGGRTYRLLSYRAARLEFSGGRIRRALDRCVELTSGTATGDGETTDCAPGETVFGGVEARASLPCTSRVTVVRGTLTPATTRVEARARRGAGAPGDDRPAPGREADVGRGAPSRRGAAGGPPAQRNRCSPGEHAHGPARTARPVRLRPLRARVTTCRRMTASCPRAGATRDRRTRPARPHP